MELSNLVRRLAEIQDELLALPNDEFAKRHELLQERDALRQEAAAHAGELDAGRSDEELLAELGSLRSQLKQLSRQKINLVSQAGESGSGEMGNVGAFDINARMMKAGGAEQIRARIGRITGLLTERGIDVPD